jgi:beta-lactamase superfamily II metal-dependent hydrolase
MTIKIFQSGKGDCMLFSNTSTHILVDGGVAPAYNNHVAKELNKLHKAGTALDLVCVSHIDEDHIAGVLKMIEDEVDWRVYDYHQSNGNSRVKAPKVQRPPQIKEIWHNSFHEILKNRTGEIESMLTAKANIMMASKNPEICEMGKHTYSVGQAIQLSKRLQPGQLNIPQNKKTGGKFVMYRKGARAMKYGSFAITILAPFAADLDNLREKSWPKWLAENSKGLKGIKEKIDRDADALANADFPNIRYYEALAEEMEPELLASLALAKEMGNRKQVTEPNLASIMFLLEENGTTVLMTGDGHADDIIRGLESTRKLKKKEGLHVDMLKIQHHGANANMTLDFCSRITADYYVFCGNGEHHNPERQVVEAIIDSRTKNFALTAQAKNPFNLIFNSSSDAADDPENRKHMSMLETFVAKAAAKHSNLRYQFMPADKDYLQIKF